jgi:hypothetical protein
MLVGCQSGDDGQPQNGQFEPSTTTVGDETVVIDEEHVKHPDMKGNIKRFVTDQKCDDSELRLSFLVSEHHEQSTYLAKIQYDINLKIESDGKYYLEVNYDKSCHSYGSCEDKKVHIFKCSEWIYMGDSIYLSDIGFLKPKKLTDNGAEEADLDFFENVSDLKLNKLLVDNAEMLSVTLSRGLINCSENEGE